MSLWSGVAIGLDKINILRVPETLEKCRKIQTSGHVANHCIITTVIFEETPGQYHMDDGSELFKV
jgi:hypothetical protein